MSKKVLSILLAVVMVISIVPIATFAEEDITSYLTYEINNGEVTITDCDESISGNITIPDTIEGYPVTSIGAYAFRGCTSLTSITIPDSVISIGRYAFDGCTGLADITILSDDIEFIARSSFQETAYYNDKSTWEDGVLYIGKYLIAADENLIPSEYTVKDGTVCIAQMAFESCDNLETIIIADSVTTIVSHAFYVCQNLNSVKLPKNLKKCEYPFIGCYSLPFDGIILPDGIEVIPANLYSGWKETGIIDLVLPESVKEISAYTFEGSLTLDSIFLSENIEFVGEYAFYTCPFLSDITLYNKDVILEEKSIGYSTMIVTGDKAECRTIYKEYIDLYYAGKHEEGMEIFKQIEQLLVFYDEPQPDPNFTIYGYKGSTAETYANENNLKFVPICEHNYIDTVITPATYSQPGKGGEVCEHCGDVKSTYEIPCFEIEDSVEEEDKDTGVSVIFPDGAFDDADVKIEVTPVEDGDAYKLISHKQGNYKVTMFDISITADGEKVQPNGTVLVKIPLPRGYNQNKCVVYYVADDGTMEELKTYHYKDGYVYFETNHFSYYAVIEDVAEEEETDFFSSIKNFFASIKAFFENFINILKNFLGIVA